MLLASFLLAGALSAPSAVALGCSNIPASAIDQYCEMTPTATGGRVPGTGQAPLAGALTPRQRLRLAGSPIGRRLARLPAAHRLGRTSTSIATPGTRSGSTTGAGVSALSLGLPLIGVLVLLGIGIVGIAAGGRRRGSAGS
jgi:hypothetical protein